MKPDIASLSLKMYPKKKDEESIPINATNKKGNSTTISA